MRGTVLLVIVLAAHVGGAGAQDVFAPGVVSTSAVEYSPAFGPNPDEVFFARRTSFDEPPAIHVSHYTNGAWQPATEVPFTSPHGDEYPSLSPDGQRLYFSSLRPLPGGTEPRSSNALWYVTRMGDSWSDPRPVSVEGLGDAMASHPVEAEDGTLYFHSRRPGGPGRVDAWSAPRTGSGFGTPVLLPINSPRTDGEVVLLPGGQRMVFYSDRDGGLGAGDLYAASLRTSGWTGVQNLGPAVNSSGWEWTPSISPDGRFLFFARLNESFSRSDILYVEISSVPALNRP